MADIKRQIELAVTGIIFIITLIAIFANAVPEIQTAGDALNATGVPLGALFSNDGVVVFLIMLSLLVTVMSILTIKPQRK